MKIAGLFPGQGSQFVGMGKDYIDSPFFTLANQVLSYDLKMIVIEGPEEKLQKTEITQPAIFTISTILYNHLKSRGINFDILAGHSIGEYAALYAAGSIGFSDAILLVSMRGKYMQEAVPNGKGSMAAIIGFDENNLRTICTNYDCDLANYNCPNQIVISGIKDQVEKVIEKCKAEGAKKIIPLKVSAPFHSKYMLPAAKKLEGAISKTYVLDAKVPVISNVTADIVSSSDRIKNLLVKQVTAPVNWTKSVERMLEYGIDTFIEIGPGKVLSGLVKKIVPSNYNYKIYNVYDLASCQDTIDQLRYSFVPG